MKIISIPEYQNTYQSKLKVPNRNRVIQETKQEYITELKAKSIADIFKKFENNFRSTLETFRYMIKN